MAEARYDRNKIVEAAARARSKGRYRRAIALYRRVLAVEPAHLELHARLAPLLAATGQDFDAWIHFQTCADTALREKHPERAVAVYREAVRCMPRHYEAWTQLASQELVRGRQREALAALAEGRAQLRRRGDRPQAIALLRRSLQIDPEQPEVVLDLSRLLARSQQEGEARLRLDALAKRSSGVTLRRVRGAQWRIAPTLGNTWRWLRDAVAALGSNDEVEGETLRA